MNTGLPESFDSFQWMPRPETFRFVCELADGFLEMCPEAAAFAERMKIETGTRFVDWLDHIRLNRRDKQAGRLEEAGYRPAQQDGPVTVYENHAGAFPAILVWDGGTEFAIKVESVADFLAANGLQRHVFGSPLASLRTCPVYAAKGCALNVVERHGTRGFEADAADQESGLRRLEHAEKFRTRPRGFESDQDVFDAANQLIDDAIADLGHDLACALWFAAEREFWMRRNRAARIQKSRQDRLGLGWANHDHHTYRSSRKNFKRLIATWEKLGFRCRERFYAGREAGWGAQVMEQPVAGIVTFNDVDLTPDELIGDFGHDGLEEQNRLGTVGLWCGLHGDSFSQSGMHHLAALLDFDPARGQLEAEGGVKMMPPFTDFPYLRQAFTVGERWVPAPENMERLQHAGAITAEQAGQFRTSGAIGSHLENIERNEGFKGFNQAGVNEIIHATDPRKNVGA